MRLAVLACAAALTSCGSFGTTPAESQQDGGPIAPRDGGDGSTPVPPLASYPREVLSDKPLAYWRLEDKVLNGRAHAEIGPDATVVGVPMLGAKHPLKDEPENLGFGFNGDPKDGLEAGMTFDFAGNAPFTLETWLRLKDVDTSYGHIFTKDSYPNGAGREEYGLFAQEDIGLQFERHVDGEKLEVTAKIGAGERVKLSTWHHVVATYSGTELALWVDALLVGKKADTRSQASKPVPFVIGRKNAQGDALNGELDEIAVYDRALSEEQIKRHYEAAVGRQ